MQSAIKLCLLLLLVHTSTALFGFGLKKKLKLKAAGAAVAAHHLLNKKKGDEGEMDYIDDFSEIIPSPHVQPTFEEPFQPQAFQLPQPQPFQIPREVKQPVCPMRVSQVWKEEVVPRMLHTVKTEMTNVHHTQWQYATKVLTYPVTVNLASTHTITPPPVVITETKVYTVTATNTVTTTRYEEEWITVTKDQTHVETVDVPITRMVTDWKNEVLLVTQPIYVTTSLWIEAPKLYLETSTVTVSHYHTSTTFVTSAIFETVCPDKFHHPDKLNLDFFDTDKLYADKFNKLNKVNEFKEKIKLQW